jgi:fumarylpyruvate hydrolase
MAMLFPLSVPRLPVVGRGDEYPVRRIYCVGRNYADHAREMGASGREPPFFFAKPADAVVPVAPGSCGEVNYPPRTASLHHEVELVVAIGAAGTAVPVREATRLVFGYAVGIDLTRRDLQAELKKKGHPWEMAKGFDQSAPVGALLPADPAGNPPGGVIALSVNGEERQHGRLEDMIWSVPEVIAELSAYVELRPGDLIYTGTPAGVGAVVPGDRITARIDGVGELQVAIAVMPPAAARP